MDVEGILYLIKLFFVLTFFLFSLTSKPASEKMSTMNPRNVNRNDYQNSKKNLTKILKHHLELSHPIPTTTISLPPTNYDGQKTFSRAWVTKRWNCCLQDTQIKFKSRLQSSKKQ